MRTRMVEEREGEDMGPIDWDHEKAKALSDGLRAKLRAAEQDPTDWRYSPSGFSSFSVIKVCMYDGWPYWKPTPAFCYYGPLGLEWAHFDSYGVSEHSVFKRMRPHADETRSTEEKEQ